MNKAPAHSHPEKTPHTKSEEPGNVLRTIDPLASQPDSRDPKKTRFRPNPKTVGIIRQIQHGKSNNEIVAETGASVPNIRMIRSRLEKGKYEI